MKQAFKTYPVVTLRDILIKACQRYGEKVACKTKYSGAFQPATYEDIRVRTEKLATCLFNLGVEKGDRVAILGENRTEWLIAYFAVTTAGFVGVPIDRDLKEREIRHILDFSEAKVLIASDDYLKLIQYDRESLPALQTTISMGGLKDGSDLSFVDALAQGAEILNTGDRNYATAEVYPDDLAVIIFTSGTTGTSKGVMLSHENIASNVVGSSFHICVDKNDTLLSVLPMHHTYEATAGMLTAFYQGATVCHAESLRRIVDNLVETKATAMLAVPAIYEAIYRRIKAGIEQKGKTKFAIAKGVASLSEKILRKSIRKKLFHQVHDKIGGHLRLLISGGAALAPEISRGFRELGIDFMQGYGLTEFSPIISVNRLDKFKDGTAGVPIPCCEVKIENNEIVVKGPCVMQGYYKNQAATDEVIKDGWLYTGDLGFLDKDGLLHINGRSKSVIVTSNGKNIYPEEIEFLLQESEYVLESLVWGGPDIDPSQVEVQAIIVPNSDTFDEEFGPSAYDDDKIEEIIAQVVKRTNRQLANYKRLKKFTLRTEEFEKTTTRKIKRYLYTGKPRGVNKRQ
ncbi:MAG: AMP-binding protein [Acidobacteriota bacterium]